MNTMRNKRRLTAPANGDEATGVWITPVLVLRGIAAGIKRAPAGCCALLPPVVSGPAGSGRGGRSVPPRADAAPGELQGQPW